jgi:hypothetical protein
MRFATSTLNRIWTHRTERTWALGSQGIKHIKYPGRPFNFGSDIHTIPQPQSVEARGGCEGFSAKSRRRRKVSFGQ